MYIILIFPFVVSSSINVKLTQNFAKLFIKNSKLLTFQIGQNSWLNTWIRFFFKKIVM